ncbi:MAG: zinc-binding dehydrogenase [Halieaceae bacterium]
MRSVTVTAPGGPDVLQLVEAVVPQPAAGEALIEVAYAALNPLDNHARADRIKWNHPGYPFTPGFEFCGRVSSVGDGVDEALIGQRVATNGQWGGNADFAVVPAHSLVAVPDAFDWQLASCFSTCAYTAWLLVHSAAQVKSGQWVVVHSAAGAVGSLVIQIAKSAGARVIGMVGGEHKFAFVEQFGPDAVIDYLRDDWPEAVKALTEGRGADVIFDGNAGDRAPMNLDAIAALGHIVYLGASAGQAPPVPPSMLIGKSCSMSGFVQYFHQAVSGGAEVTATHDALAGGVWRIPIEREFDLTEIADAHRAWEARELLGRSVIRVGGDV